MKGRKTQTTGQASFLDAPSKSNKGLAAANADRDVKPELKTGSRVSQCVSCERFFTGVGPFDMHFKELGTADPICMTDSEMLASGMTRNKYGVWQRGTRGYKPKPPEAA